MLGENGSARRELTPRRGLKKLLAGGVSHVLMATAAVGVALALPHPVKADTLADAMVLAYTGNPTLLAGRAQLRATDENVPIALSGWRPTLTVSGDIGKQRVEDTAPGVAGQAPTVTSFVQDTSKQAAVIFSQPLFRGFRTVAGTAEAEDQVYAQRAHLSATEAQVLLNVATAYLDVLRNQSVVELNMNNVQVLSRQLDATNDRFRVGELTRTDVAEAQASLEGARAALVLAEGTLQQSRANYENVVGKAPENMVQPPIPSNLPASLDAAVAASIAANPNYVAADYTARAADQNITVVRGQLLPSVSFVAEWQKGYDVAGVGYRAEQTTAQAQVTVPLYQSGAEYASLRQAKDVAGQEHLLADQARLDAKNTATSAWEAYQAATASIDSFKSQVAAGEISVEGLQRQMEVGSATILDVLIQQQNLLTARVNLVGALHDQEVAAYQILAAVGLLTGQGVGLNTPLFDPTAHYRNVKFEAFGSDKDANNDARIGKK